MAKFYLSWQEFLWDLYYNYILNVYICMFKTLYDHTYVCTYFFLYIEFIEGVHPTGPALVYLFTPGTRVVRGPDWEYDDQVIM